MSFELILSELLELHMILYSKLTELVQVFPCPFHADEPTELVPVPDPFLLEVPSEVNESVTEKGSTVHYSTLLFREIGHTPATVGKSNYNPYMKLTKLFWIDSSFAVHESLFRLPDGKPEEEDEMHLETSKVLRLKKRHQTPRKKADMNDENFIVDDWDETVAPPLAGVHQKLSSDSDLDLQWTLNLTSIYASAVANLAVGRSPDNHASALTFDQLILNQENDMTASSEGWASTETM